MTLENLLRIGRLRHHAATRAELERLLAAADRALADATHEEIGADTRFGLAYRAIVQASMAAMMAQGFRPLSSEPGSEQLLITSLVATVGIDPARAQVLDAFRAARNRADYSGDPVSSAVAWESVEEARELVARMRSRMELQKVAGKPL